MKILSNKNWATWRYRNRFKNNTCLNCKVVASCGGGCATGSYNGTKSINGIDYKSTVGLVPRGLQPLPFSGLSFALRQPKTSSSFSILFSAAASRCKSCVKGAIPISFSFAMLILARSSLVKLQTGFIKQLPFIR